MNSLIRENKQTTSWSKHRFIKFMHYKQTDKYALKIKYIEKKMNSLIRESKHKNSWSKVQIDIDKILISKIFKLMPLFQQKTVIFDNKNSKFKISKSLIPFMWVDFCRGSRCTL